MNEALVIKRIDFEETSLILNVLSKEGIMPLMVKGAKRKNSNKLSISEPLTLIEYEKTKSKFPSLTEGIVKNDYRNLKNDLIKYSIASVIIEYAYEIREMEIDFSYLYDLVVMSLDELIENIRPEETLFRFEAMLSKLLGIALKKSYLIDDYMARDELLNNLDMVFSGSEVKNPSIVRSFFNEYFKRELGLSIKSKKLYFSFME